MKFLLVLFCTSFAISCFAQFHVKVVPNPMNEGKVNPHWVNNYVIAYTCNNWSNTQYLKYNATYRGYDDNGRIYFSVYYETLAFGKLEDAILMAKQFKTAKNIGVFESENYTEYTKMKKHNDEEIKKLCFGCKKDETAKAKEVNIY